MTVVIQYKSDISETPYCAYTSSLKEYACCWSSKSFEDAKERLIKNIELLNGIDVPEDEKVEI